MLKIKKMFLSGMLAFAGLAQAESSNCSSSGCAKDCEDPISQNLWQPHAFSGYASREILIMKDIDFDVDKEWISRVGFATEYMQNFGHECRGLGALPFWSGTNTMTIGNNDGLADLDAYQFGLGDVVTVDGIGGSITLQPKVQHVGTELLWYLVENKDKPGFYAKVKLPVGAMIMDNKLCETPAKETGANVYTGNFVDDVGIALFAPPTFFPTISAALAGGTYLQNPIYRYGKVESCCNQTTIRVGDLGAVVGVNFVEKQEGHFGVGFKVSCPTGNVPTAEYMLEPIFGRAGHWGVGGELTAHYRRDCGDCSYWTFWVQGEAMHLFAGRRPSFRSFDLKANGAGSKYLLIQHYAYDTDGETFIPEYIDAAINYTTLPVKSVFAVEGNFAMMFDYHRDNWNIAVGGEFWGRSKECLSIDTCNLNRLNNTLFDYNLNNWAVLGRQIGRDDQTWCEPAAKINESVARQTTTNNFPLLVFDATDAENRIPSDYSEALDIAGAAAHKIFTGKVLGELGYTWSEHTHHPHVGVFGGAEFSANNHNWVNLWSVGLQGSLQF